MNNETRTEYVTRDSIMKLLSDEEIARVSTAEAGTRLSNGDEYVDLEHLDQGVRRSPETATPMGHVLPRKAVHEKTWSKILAHLASPDLGTSRPVADEGLARRGFFESVRRAARAVFH